MSADRATAMALLLCRDARVQAFLEAGDASCGEGDGHVPMAMTTASAAAARLDPNGC